MDEDIVSPIMGARYISAVALSCLLYDHLLHFDDELTDIWLNIGKRTILKSMFLLGRYSTIICVIYTARGIGSFNTKMDTQEWVPWNSGRFCPALMLPISCQIWIIVVVVFCGLSMVGTEGIVIYRLRSLWYFNRSITRAIATMVVVVSISATVCLGVEIAKVRYLFHPVHQLPGCVFISSSSPSAYMVVLGLALVIWDIFNVCIFTFNTFATPYQCSSDVLAQFKRDGGRYFLYLLVVHSLYLFTAALGKNSRFSTVPLVLSLAAIINARIFHGIALETEQYTDEYNTTLPKVVRGA